MPEKFKVDRGYIIYKRKRYDAGDLLPETFTERDRARNIYSRRLVKVATPVIEVNIPEQVPNTPADKPLVSKPTGASAVAKVSPAKQIVK